MALNYGLTFTNQTLVQIPASQHNLGHGLLRCQVWDGGTPRQRLHPAITVDPVTFTVTMPFLQLQSGLVVLQGAAPLDGSLGNRAFPFAAPAGGTVTISGTQHGFGTDHLLIDVYTDSNPRVWLPYAAVSVDPATFAVSASFLQPQSGILVISAAADIGLPNQGYPLALAPGGTMTIAGSTHNRGTANLGFQVYDAQGHNIIPSQVTVDPTTFAVTLTTLDALTGTLVLGGSDATTAAGPRMVIAIGGELLLGGASQGQRSTALEQTTGYYTCTFVDELGASVPATVLETLQCTYYDAVTGAVINGRLHQNVLGANHGTLESVGTPPATTLTLELTPADAAILDQTHASEQRTLLFQWTWAGGQRAGAHMVSFTVNNLTFVP